MSPKKAAPANEGDASAEIDAIIAGIDDWRGVMLSQLRTTIVKADGSIVEEVKWKKPSRPEGVPVWSSNGIVCVGEPLKSAVRLTFPNGASLRDPRNLFDARLESKTARAIDVHEGEKLDKAALKRLITDAVAFNAKKKSR